jgi:hypothetical protein
VGSLGSAWSWAWRSCWSPAAPSSRSGTSCSAAPTSRQPPPLPGSGTVAPSARVGDLVVLEGNGAEVQVFDAHDGALVAGVLSVLSVSVPEPGKRGSVEASFEPFTVSAD